MVKQCGYTVNEIVTEYRTQRQLMNILKSLESKIKFSSEEAITVFIVIIMDK